MLRKKYIYQNTITIMWFKTLFYIILSVLFIACNTKNSKKEKVIATEIEYWVSITEETENENLSLIEEDAKNQFLTELFDKVKKGELPVYYYRMDTLEKMDENTLHDIFYNVDTIYEFEGLKLTKTVVKDTLDVNSITRFKFKEKWLFDSATNQFLKKVIAIAPMQTRYINMDEIMGYKGLFWVYFPD
ncbi:MAG: gliding motility protein GldN [Bacteroidota bacterium]